MAVVDDQTALLVAARALLGPLARLMVAGQVPYERVAEALQEAMRDAARPGHADTPADERDARPEHATGLPPAPQRSPAAEVFTRWLTAPAYQDATGQPRVLPRGGPAPSFESLVRGVDAGVAPGGLLSELVRLGLATWLPDRDVVVLVRRDYVPRADLSRMLQFLAHNVGDHLAAAVENVVSDVPPHVERAVYVNGLSRRSVVQAERWVSDRWAQLLAELAPMLEGLLARDEADPGAAAPCRFRAGLYAYACDSVSPAPAAPAPPVPAAAGVRPDHRFAAAIREAFIAPGLD